jgi:hypothetical protein
VSSPSRSPPDRPVQEAYDRGDDETLELAIARAFERVGIDLMDQETPLHDAVNVDALRDLHRETSETPVTTTLVLYERPVTITHDAVLIHEPVSG